MFGLRFASLAKCGIDWAPSPHQASVIRSHTWGRLTFPISCGPGSIAAAITLGVTLIDPHGTPFDPQVHEAMAMVENPAVEPNTVIDVMQKGYSLNGRLVRAAKVIVSKAGG